MNSYSRFADYYDALTRNVDYKKRASYFHQILSGQNLPGNILLDLACGTGSLSVEFSRLGYDVIGVDASEDMLSQALQKKSELNLDIIFLCQTMQELDLYGTVDGAVCALDSLNHITNPTGLQKALDRVSLFLHPQGTFVFDVNTPYKQEEVLGDNVFVYDCDEVYCVWQNRYAGEGITDIRLDFFEPQTDGSYRRFQEEFSERAYSVEELSRMLSKAGLRVTALYGDDTFSPPGENAQRLIFVTKKKSSL